MKGAWDQCAESLKQIISDSPEVVRENFGEKIDLLFLEQFKHFFFLTEGELSKFKIKRL